MDINEDRVAGTLIGVAVGDALGAHYEFTHPAPDTEITMCGGGPFGWEPGEWTDDTAMTVAVARGLLVGGAISTEGRDAVADEFRRWLASGPKDIGRQTKVVLLHSVGDADAMTAFSDAQTGRTGGNGSLMRTAPVALRHLANEQACIDGAFAISRLTHSDPHAGQACALWSYAIRHAVIYGNFDGPRRYLAEAPRDVASEWTRLLDEAENGVADDFRNNGWVVHALQTAWWAITAADDGTSDHLVRALEATVLAGRGHRHHRRDSRRPPRGSVGRLCGAGAVALSGAWLSGARCRRTHRAGYGPGGSLVG